MPNKRSSGSGISGGSSRGSGGRSGNSVSRGSTTSNSYSRSSKPAPSTSKSKQHVSQRLSRATRQEAKRTQNRSSGGIFSSLVQKKPSHRAYDQAPPYEERVNENDYYDNSYYENSRLTINQNFYQDDYTGEVSYRKHASRSGRHVRLPSWGSKLLKGVYNVLFAVLILFIFLPALMLPPYVSDSEVLPSQPEKIFVNETEYFTDQLGWIEDADALTAGMVEFYETSGVQPYVYLTDSIDGIASPEEADIDRYAGELYDALFTDEGHLMILVYDSGEQYALWYIIGADAGTVVGDAAIDALMADLDANYNDLALTEEAVFSNTFYTATERLLETPAPTSDITFTDRDHFEFSVDAAKTASIVFGLALLFLIGIRVLVAYR